MTMSNQSQDEETLNDFSIAWWIKQAEPQWTTDNVIAFAEAVQKRTADKYDKALKAAEQALRSYEYGNDSPTLAKSVADWLARFNLDTEGV